MEIDKETAVRTAIDRHDIKILPSDIPNFINFIEVIYEDRVSLGHYLVDIPFQDMAIVPRNLFIKHCYDLFLKL